MDDPIRIVSDAERRARLGIRHALGESEHVKNPLAAASAVVCLHSTEPATVYLSAFARARANRTAVDDALYSERNLVKQLAMRRTVFAFPSGLLPAVRGSAAARVAAQQAALLARSAEKGGLTKDGAAWVNEACAMTFELLREAPMTTSQLRVQLPVLNLRLNAPERGVGAAPTPVASRVLTVLGAGGAVVRGANGGGWTVSRPYWTLAEEWLQSPGPIESLTEAEGYAELVRRWLWAFGPGTEADITWWLGATKTATRRTLLEVGAIRVQLEDGSPAWLHPDDTAIVSDPLPWAALLPALDPTTMGWRGRGFYVDEHTAAVVYDRAGNGKPTAWWNGRIVGGWAQQEDGIVVVELVAPLPQRAVSALRREAKELTAWLNGDLIRSSFQSPLPRNTSRELLW